jgi:hypothetical protein
MNPMKKHLRSLAAVFLGAAACLSMAASAAAEDINDIFKKVNELVQAKNYSKALEELGWAKKEIEKMNSKQLESYFPDTLNGFKGQPVSASNALGFTNIERLYKKDESTSVKVSLTGSGPGGVPGGLGGLAAFGKMAAMMGNNGDGSDTFRINGRTAQLEEHSDEKRAELTVFLDSGSILKFEGSNTDGGALKQMAEALKIGDLDTYLKGGA